MAGLLHIEQHNLALPSGLGLLRRIAKITLPLALLAGRPCGTTVRGGSTRSTSIPVPTGWGHLLWNFYVKEIQERPKNRQLPFKLCHRLS